MKLKLSFFKIIILLCFIGYLPMYGQGVNYVGTSAANFLKIGMGAKVVGSAESDITSFDDASSLYWNPGAISRITETSASFSYLSWIAGSNLTYLAATLPTDMGTVGLDITYFTSGDFEETTLAQQDGTGRYISANDLSIGLAIARNLTDRFSVGVKAKYIRESLADVNASAFAFDIGSVFTTSFLNNLKLGITLSNFGSSLQFSGNNLLVTHAVPGSPTNKQVPANLQTESWNLPLYFRFGLSTVAISSKDYKFKVNAAILDSRDYQTRFNIGGSLQILQAFTLRGGYRFKYGEATFSAGMGVHLRTNFVGSISFDYAYTDFGYFNGLHQFSLGFNF